MKKYYLHGDNGQEGPYDIDELRNKLINRDTPIWCEGLQNWTTAGEVDELKPLFPISSPPPFFETNVPPPFKGVHEKKHNTEKAGGSSQLFFRKKSSIVSISVIGGLLIVLFFLWIIGVFNTSNRNYEYSSENNTTVIETKTEKTEKKQKKSNHIEQEKIDTKVAVDNKKHIRNNWQNYIYAKRSSYTYKEIGGISDLYITLYNETDYMLDIVYTWISYIKADGTEYSRERVFFYDVPAHTTVKKKAPDSNRGTSVGTPVIEQIQASQLEFCFGTDAIRLSESDPYWCK